MALNIWDRFRFALARGLIKAAGLPIVTPYVNATFMTPTFQALVREAYQTNGVVAACLSVLACSFPEPPLVALDDGGDLQPNSPLIKLLNNPNPLMGLPELQVYTIIYMALGGNAYWYKVRSRAGRVVELWPYHAGQISPVPGGDKWILRYDYDPGTGSKIPIPVEDVVHFKWPLPDPEQPWVAMAALRSVARNVDHDNEITRYLFTLMKNDAVPRMALVLPAGVTLSDTQYNRLENQWKQRHGGDNRGGVGIVEGGADIKHIAFGLREMEAKAFYDIPETRIAGALRVPPILAGLNVGLEHGTLANFREARQWFTEGTLSTLWVLSAGEINSSLAREFGEGVTAAYDLGNVKILTENENDKWKRVNDAVTGGWLPVNVGLRELGFEEVEGQDVFLRGLNIAAEPARAKAFAVSLRPSSTPTRLLSAKATRRQAALRAAAALQRVRSSLARKMEGDIDRYFADLAEQVVARARKSLDGYKPGSVRVRGGHATAEMKVTVRDLLKAEDDEVLEKIVAGYYIQVISASWETWNLVLGVEEAFDLTDPAVAETLKVAGGRIKEISDTTREAVQELLVFGNEQGWSVDQLVRGDETHPGLRSIVEETYKDRARNVARTELSVAQNTATTRRYADNGVKRVLVLDNGQDDPDAECARVNGTTQTLAWAEEHPLEHPQCIIGNTQVIAPNLLAGYAREFHGEVIVLHTAANHDLTCTANHAILTGRGWVPAGKLRQGDQVACSLEGEGIMRLLDPDNHQMPTTIENLFGALLKSGGVTARPVPGSPIDFHGDGGKGDVNIVLVNGFLESYLMQADRLEKARQFALAFGDQGLREFLMRLGAPNQLGMPSFRAAHGGMRRRRISETLLSRPAAGDSFLSIAQGEHRPSQFPETPTHRGGHDAGFARQVGNGLTRNIARVQSRVISSGAQDKAAFVKGAPKLIVSQSCADGDLLDALAAQMSLIELVKVEREFFAGHVYNLSTVQNWYVSNGIVTHNCTRAFSPWFES
jgi:HK97 family phage portal protein